MKTGTATYKVPGGKLLRIDLTYENSIDAVKLTGDFFLHPEEALETITSALCALALPLDADEAIQQVEAALAAQNAQLIGATARDIVHTLGEALK